MDKPISLEQAKMRVRALVGRNILFKVNKGRNKFIEFSGTIDNVYPSIFTVDATIDEERKTMSYSYNDVLTKSIKFYKGE